MQSSESAWKGSVSDTKVSMRSGHHMGFTNSPIVHHPSGGRMPTAPYPFMSPVAGYPPGAIQQSPMVYHGMPPPHHAPYSASRAEGTIGRQRSGSMPEGEQSADYAGYSVAAPIAKKPSAAIAKRKLPPKKRMEPKSEYFGPDVESQTKRAVLSVFSYLDNDELFNASIVSKEWCQLTLACRRER